MIRAYVATGDALAVVRGGTGRWQAELQLVGWPTQAVAADPLRPEVVYCGTFGRGLWGSADAGRSWERLPVDWPEGYRFSHVHGLAVVEIV